VDDAALRTASVAVDAMAGSVEQQPGGWPRRGGLAYRGAVVGVAEREGLVVDRVVHVASPGAGWDVRSVQDDAGAARADRCAMPARVT